MKSFLVKLSPVSIILLVFVSFTFVSWTQTVQDNLYVTDGPVNAIVRSGNTIYIGGQFNKVGPATGSLVALTPGTAVRDATYPTVIGSVYAILSDGSGGFYLGGYFSSINNIPRKNLAHIKADKTVDENWNPTIDADGAIFSLALTSTSLYIGGNFTTVGGVLHNKLAEINLIDGTPSSWAPQLNYHVNSLFIDKDSSILYVGGDFTTINTMPRNKIASFSLPSGTLTDWNPNANGKVNSINASGQKVYIGGYFTQVGGQSRKGIACIDSATGTATSWNANSNGSVNSILLFGTKVYVGGSFSNIGGEVKWNIASLDSSTGLETGHANPDAIGIIYDMTLAGSNIYAVGSDGATAFDANTGLQTSWKILMNNDSHAVVSLYGKIFVGGDFTSAGSSFRPYIAALNATTGEVTDWNPQANGTVYALAVKNSVVYAGGEFTSISGDFQQGISALDSATGYRNENFDIEVRGIVHSLLISGSTLYVGGEFENITGAARSDVHNLASIDVTTHLVTDWWPGVGDVVHALASAGNTLYVGGSFQNIYDEVYRPYLAAFDMSTGFWLSNWNPNVNADVFSLAANSTTVFVGGNEIIASLDGVTGELLPWEVGTPDAQVEALTIAGGTLYLGGTYSSLGSLLRPGIASINIINGTVNDWYPELEPISGGVFAIQIVGQMVYVGGDFLYPMETPHSHFLGITDTSLEFTYANAVKYRTFTADTLQLDSYQRPVLRPNFPNTANAIMEIYKRNPLALLIVGKPNQIHISGKAKGYVQPRRYNEVLRTFNTMSLKHTQFARGLDWDKKGVLLFRKFPYLNAGKHNNKLLANLMALQVNITASDYGVTPYGFPDLLYDDGPDNPLSGKTVSEIAEYANHWMSNWEYQPLSVYEHIDTTVRKINEAFSGPFDTTSWLVRNRLVVKGTVPVGSIGYLKPNTSGFRHREIPLASLQDIAPSSYALRQNYPNPFNPTTAIQFELQVNSFVTLKVYNMLGQEVATLLEREEIYEGESEVSFDGKELSSGVYLYRLVAEPTEENDEEDMKPFVEVKKMVLIK